MDKNRESLAEFLGRHSGIVTAYYPREGYKSIASDVLLRRARAYHDLPESVSAAGSDSWRSEP